MITCEELIKNAITFPCNGKIPKIKNWNHLTQKVPHQQNENYGILTGSINNLIIIDCDLLKDDDPTKYTCGVQLWNYLVSKNSYLTHFSIPTVQTKSGGLHLYFKYNPNLISAIQKLTYKNKIVKIDVLSDNKFAVGPGSNGYKFINNSQYLPIPEMPSLLIDLFKYEPELKIKESSNSQTSIACESVSKEKLRRVVYGIPKEFSDNYEDWIKVVWAIAETGKQNGYDSFDIADEFSRESDKYDYDHLRKVFDGNKGDISFGSLVFWSSDKPNSPKPGTSKSEDGFYKEPLLNDLNKIKGMNVKDIIKLNDENDKKILEVLLSNDVAEQVFLFKNNLATIMNNEFKGYLKNKIDIEYDLSIFHPAFKNKNCKGFFIDENTFDFLYKEENGAEHRIRLRNPYNNKKSCYTIHSYEKQLGSMKTKKQDVSMLLDAITPSCHKILKDDYNITVNCQIANFNFGNENEKEIRAEEDFITGLIESHPSIQDYMKFCNPNQSSFDGIYVCSPQTGIWKKQHNSTVERMLTTRFKWYLPGLKEHELKYIKTQSNIQSIRKMFIGFIVDDDFESKIDENRNVFAMTNHVYDLKQNKLRKANWDDYIFTNTGWVYDEKEAIKYLPHVEKFFKQLFPIQEEHDVAVTFLSSLIHGYRLDKKFIVLTDKRNGNNGKSTLIALLRRFFGDYTKTSNKFLLKGSFDKDKDSHDGGLEPLKGKRILICDELKKNMRLDEGLIKNLAGGEYTVEGRRLGKATQFKFIWQAGIVMIFNEGDCPKFDCTDNAFMERLVVVPMRSKFVNDEEDPETFTFKRDADITDKFDLWRSALLNFFLKYINKKGLNEVKIPPSMRKWKEEILNENNELRDWLFSFIQKDDSGFISLNELKDKYRLAFPHDRSLKNKDIERMINSLFNNIGVYLKERYQYREDGKKIEKRNVYIGYKFITC